MNERYGITAENLLSSLPQVLRDDPSMYALAAATAEVLAARPTEIDKLRIYSRIDELSEELLDILAYDFKVDWWDGDYSLEEKRKTLKDSWRVHRMLGTKAAVETAISAIYPNTTVQEWFEYGGEPYHFRLCIDASDSVIDLSKQRRVLKRLEYYKNLRSWNDRIEYHVNLQDPVSVGAGAVFLGIYTRYDVEVPITGAVGWPRVEMTVPAVSAAVGAYERVTADVTVTGALEWPRVEIAAPVASAAVGVYKRATAEVAINGAVDWPRSQVIARSGAAVKGVYQKIVTEVSANGMEP